MTKTAELLIAASEDLKVILDASRASMPHNQAESVHDFQTLYERVLKQGLPYCGPPKPENW